METLIHKTQDPGFEKHLPIIEKTDTEIIVKVGSIPHPMEEAHFIEWIEIIADDKVYKQLLKAGDQPIVTFKITADKIIARAFCNLHGLWQSE